jgi:TPR repeat protein
VSQSPDIITALKQAARTGSLSAAFILGRLYDEGWGVTHNSRTATRWYLKAGKGGLPEAFYFVASAYDGGDGVAPDPKQALAWYRRAAAAGDKVAKFVLAVRVLEGRGVRRDESAGVRRLRRLAGHDSGAMDYLAYYYLRVGRFSLAKKWAARALEYGETDARARLAEIDKAHRLDLARRAENRERVRTRERLERA